MSDTKNKKQIDFNTLTDLQKSELLFKQAVSAHQKNDFTQAISFYSQSLSFNPLLADALSNMAVALRKTQKFEAALACYKRSLHVRPHHSGTYSNMGNVLNDLDQLDKAITAHKTALELEPDNLLYQYNLAIVLRDAGKLDEALALFDQVLEQEPNFGDCPWDRSLTNLMAGNLKIGFDQYESRWHLEKTHARSFPQPRWNGEDLTGKTLFIHREQGFGDAIQFARFISLVKERYSPAKIILECQPELIKLFQSLADVDELHPNGQALPEFDMWIPQLSLGQVLDFDLDTLPAQVPYLSVSNDNPFNIRKSRADNLKIGIVWAGSPTHKNDRRRSLTLEHFLALFERPETLLFSLQKGSHTKDIKEHGAEGLITDPSKNINNFYDTACLLEKLDLIICVDTSVAHLAGAMGKEVWVLVPFTPDWRWLTKREDSPWYPTMRLFRQTEAGNWDHVFERVLTSLDEKLADRNPSLQS